MMESSTTTRRLPRTAPGMGFSFSFTPRSRSDCDGSMNVRPTYRFFMSPSPYGIPLAAAYPAAAEPAVSGTGSTMSASTDASAASASPIRRRASWTVRPSSFESARARYTNSNRHSARRGDSA